ncbi:ATP-dependent Clp protease proteolytic subunit-related protein like [Actinidia chinensis var. chinensis]|uniref:ATP-dependent Clp protease proteolytic subunit n=1 Tax=Actinidia chinensis var. chinensis TaxID=1590841 RepID=A0A2R6PIK1_ACTCC|nr:ATP-dependent Clp protease proteolytic subunit-related protein like [Actinidia chinensis var. chinensis]
MEVVTMTSHFFPTPTATPTRTLSSPKTSRASLPKRNLTLSPPRASLSSNFPSPYDDAGEFSGHTLRPESLNPCSPSRSHSRPKRDVIANIIMPFVNKGDPYPAPDLASTFFEQRIIYLGLPVVIPVVELLLVEFLTLQFIDPVSPIYFYINSTGTTKGGTKVSYETEAIAVYDIMRCVKNPIYTLCIGYAWGEAALLLAAGTKGIRSALPSASIMLKQPYERMEGQATDVDNKRKEMRAIKEEMVQLYAEAIGKTPEQIEADIRWPKYFSPTEAVEYGIIDRVLYNEKARKDRGAFSDQKKAEQQA